MTNKLPPLPSELAGFAPSYRLDKALQTLVQAYGQACRDAALEEAAQRVAQCQGPRSSTEAAVRNLK